MTTFQTAPEQRPAKKNPFSKAFRGLLRHDLWNIGIINQHISSLLISGAEPTIQWLPRPEPAKYIADPFAVIRDQTVYIFCEEFDYRASKGRIVCIELADATPSKPSVVLDLAVHLSYPYLIEYGGEVYCIPETHMAREIALYKADAFPLGWTKIRTLVNNFDGVDPTVFQHEGRWWLASSSPGDARLFIWHSSSLFGPWQQHAANPVKVDIRSSRPAGTPFTHNDELFRPAQDCSKSYGERVIINRVTKLTPTEFVEESAVVVEPFRESPYPKGIHTISGLKDLTLIDGKGFRFDQDALRYNLRRKFLRPLVDIP